jgi:photosystem II stability/assembly factor-like uncharacterized protein
MRKHIPNLLVLFFCFLLLFVYCSESEINGENNVTVLPDPVLPDDGAYTWKPLKVGAGGWVVGMYVHPTERGLLYVRTDVSGAYRWNPNTSEWKQVVLSTTLPAGYVDYAAYEGVHSLVGAPGNPDIAYMVFRKQVFRSNNRGNTWTATTFGSKNIIVEPNGEGRQEGERLSVDPANSDVVYYGSINQGLWRTENGGDTWERVAAIPSGEYAHGVNTVIFDKESGTSGSKTNLIYVTVDNGGVFKTMDAGQNWEQIAEGGPGTNKRYRDAEIGADCAYYVVCSNDNGAIGGVWKYTPAGEWKNIAPSGSQPYQDIAIDPNNAQSLAVIRNGGMAWTSTNQGDTWMPHNNFKRVSSSIAWISQQTDNWLSVGELQFDPFEKGKLWFAEGFGVCWTKELALSTITWTEESAGIEESCGNDVICPPGGKPLTAMWDLGVFYHEDPDAYNAVRSQTVFRSGWALDWCPADPSFVVATLQSHHGEKSQCSYSSNGGKSWTKFASIPDDMTYGVVAIAAENKNNIVWLSCNGKLPYYTKNRGGSWIQGAFAGVSSSGYTSYTSPRKPLCADRVEPATFYYFHTTSGIFRSTDGGENWTKVANNPIPNCWNLTMKATPGHAGDLWLAEGKQGNVVGGLWHSANGGETWTAVAGLEQAFSFGFGKPGTEGGYPTVFAAGVAAGQYGIYRSTDSGNTWERIGAYPLGIFDNVDAMDGDKDVFGKVYICFTGAGFVYGE